VRGWSSTVLHTQSPTKTSVIVPQKEEEKGKKRARMMMLSNCRQEVREQLEGN
jgi:hypothetical protein